MVYYIQTGLLSLLILTLIYYILNPIPCLIWSLYADMLIFKDATRLKKRLIPLTIPTIAMTLLSIMSLFYGFFFYIDAHNQYHRGAFNWILALTCYFYLSYTFIMILNNRKNISSKDLFTMLFFFFPPIIGCSIQMHFQGVSTLWMSVTFSILVIYCNIQNVNTSTDYLTGLYNRRQLDTYLKRFNQSNNFPFILSFSTGYGIFKPEKHATMDDFIKHLDQKMYLSKQQYHRQHDQFAHKKDPLI